MFSGLIDDLGELGGMREKTAGRILRIFTAYDMSSLEIGASIACSGICLTIINAGKEESRRWFEVEVSSETLACTTIGQWKTGDRINLERSLKFGDPLGGHLVTGHIDGLARVIAREESGNSTAFTFNIPKEFMHLVAAKGSVTLDGVSLTVNNVKNEEFGVTIIPHTLKVTSFGMRYMGDFVNFEADLVARYLARLRDLQSPLYRKTGS